MEFVLRNLNWRINGSWVEGKVLPEWQGLFPFLWPYCFKVISLEELPLGSKSQWFGSLNLARDTSEL